MSDALITSELARSISAIEFALQDIPSFSRNLNIPPARNPSYCTSLSHYRHRTLMRTTRALNHARSSLLTDGLKRRSGAGQCSILTHTPPWRSFSGKALRTIETDAGSTRRLQTFAIETSCDDTSVALLTISSTKDEPKLKAEVLFHEKVTANSDGYAGIHPLVALDSHQAELGKLVQRAIECLQAHGDDANPGQAGYRPDFVSVTRGPGMRSNLSVGLNTAKGLALAWNVPLVGVHHMQAHALTPRLCGVLNQNRDGMRSETKTLNGKSQSIEPCFPFLSLLVSGGHTMLIDSASLIDHRILAETQDIAVGDYLDKAARAILTTSELRAPYGKALEDFAFPTNASYDYVAPKRRQEELETRKTEFGWSLSPPLADSKGGEKSSRRMVYSFAGLLSAAQRIAHDRASNTGYMGAESSNAKSDSERRDLAREVQRVAFEHLASRILLHLETLRKSHNASTPAISTIVVSGGVASNKFLRHVLRGMLDARGYSDIELSFPPPELCTDNALMIAWAGMEMYDAGYESELSIEPLRKWTMDPSAAEGGILGVGGWKHRSPG